MCARPYLAAKVKGVNLRGWRSEFEVVTGAGWRGVYETKEEKEEARMARESPSKSRQPPRVSDTFTLFVETAVKIGLITKRESYPVPALKLNSKWYTTLKADRDFIRLLGHVVEDAHVFLLLALLPNLNRLKVDGYTPFPVLDWSLFLSRVSTALRSLRFFFRIGSFQKRHEPVIWTDLKILDIASELEEIHLSNVNGTFADNGPTALASKRLKQVSLAQCAFDLKFLEKMLTKQQLTTFLYLPGTIQNVPHPGQVFSAPTIAQYLASSKETLGELALIPMSQSQRTAFADFGHLKLLDVPQPGFFPILNNEDDPSAIASLLTKHIPASLKTLSLRYLVYDDQLKIVLEQLAQLKLQGVLEHLHRVRLSFSRLSGFDALMNMQDAPNPEAKIREELGSLFDEAGFEVDICQTDV